MLLEVFLFIIGGCFAGFLAGFLGIGGGMIFVPVLVYVFQYQHIGAEYNMQFAAGTSLAIMIFTSIVTARKNLRLRRVHFPTLKQTAVWIILFSIVGAGLARVLSSNVISLIFALFLLFMFFKMLRKAPSKRQNLLTDAKNCKISISKKTSFMYGSIIGLKSGLLGIGGGSITVPYLTTNGLPIKVASGTSSVFTLILSLIGTMSFMLLGFTDHIHQPEAIGYVYIPAVLLITPFSMMCAPLGISTATHVNGKFIRIAFLGLLLLLSIKMLSHYIITV